MPDGLDWNDFLREQERRARERASWEYRLVKHIEGRNTKWGAVLLAVLGKNRRGFPRWGEKCVIDEQDCMYALFWNHYGERVGVCKVGTTIELRDAFRQLSDEITLLGWEREELFTKLRGWIAKDLRVKSQVNETPNLTEI